MALHEEEQKLLDVAVVSIAADDSRVEMFAKAVLAFENDQPDPHPEADEQLAREVANDFGFEPHVILRAIFVRVERMRGEIANGKA